MSPLKTIKLDTIKNLFIFFPTLLYAPFFFSEVINSSLRIGYFFIVSFYLFFSNKKFFKKDLILLVLLILLVSIFLINIQEISAIFTAGNYLLTIFFGWSLHRYFLASNTRKYSMLDFYVKFYYLVILSSALSLIFLLTFGELDFFGLKDEIRTHKVTPFGVHFLRGGLGEFSVYRSFFYFVEGAHASIFYAVNTVVIAPLLKNQSLIFSRLNLLGGFLTFSMTFYAVLIILYGFKKSKSFFSFFGVLLIIAILSFIFQSIDILSYSSSEDRMERFLLFFISMNAADVSQILFGHGVGYDGGFLKAFNSGLSLSIYETGLIGTLLQLAIIYVLAPNAIIFLFFITASLVLDPIHYPLFWFLIITASHIIRTEAHLKNLVK